MHEVSADRLFQKYRVEKTDGTPVDPTAQYLVLRLDTDTEARRAAKFYADSILSRTRGFAEDLHELLRKLEQAEQEPQP